MLTRLMLSTRNWHAQVDETWHELLHPKVTIQAYATRLARAYGFMAPFESACKYTPKLARALTFQVSRAGLIAQDLLALNHDASRLAGLPYCMSITPFGTVPQAVGWLYVVERSTLLHETLRRHLVARIPVSEACTYLAAHAGHVSDHWHAFGRTLERIGATPETRDEIVAGADEGFAIAAQWYRYGEDQVRKQA